MGRILFIQIQPYAYPGLYYICGALKSKGHSYEVLASDNRQVIAEKIRAFQPDVIGFPCLTGIHREILKVAAGIKEDFPQIGWHPSDAFSSDFGG